MRRIAPVFALSLLACGPQSSPLEIGTTARGIFSEVPSFGSNPGGLKMYKYVPADVPPSAPVLFALHACSQTATEYQKAGWNELADEWKFYVVYPEQQTGNNPLRCFNWGGEYGDPTNLMRGEGENESIKQMVDKMAADHSIDPNRVYLSGHSGGAAQVALMLATWPDVFAGGAMIAGIPYYCTTTFTEVSTCLNPGIDRTAMEWGDRVRDAFPGFSGAYPRVSIWHGTGDSTVRPSNADELLEQWSSVHGVDMTADAGGTVDGADHEEYQDGSGNTLIERYLIPGMGHGTPVVPGEGCGTAGAYFLDSGICSSRRIGEFFGLDGGGVTPGDRTPPVVSITAPSDGATVQGTVSVTVDATDDVGVTEVVVAVNGNPRATLTAPPYTWTWDTSSEANGDYTLQATAVDAAGNEGTGSVGVTVQGGVEDTTPPTVNVTSPADGDMVSGTVSVTVDASDDFGVAKVDVLVDGTSVGEATTAPYEVSFDASALGEGTHAISAVAHDAAGNTATDDDTTVTVVAGDTTAPVVGFDSPADGETLSGVVRVRVSASDESSIHSVLLFLDGELIGTDYRGPDYEFLWDTATFPSGAHALTTRAFDPAGNPGVAEIQITVDQTVAEQEEPERVLAGRRYWGCASVPVTEIGGLWVLLGLLFLIRRRSP